MNDFAEPAASTEYAEVAVSEGAFTIEFVGFEALPEIQASPETDRAPAAELAAPATNPTPAIPAITVTSFLEAAPALQVEPAEFKLVPPDDHGLTAHTSTTHAVPRRGTMAYAAHHWELAA